MNNNYLITNEKQNIEENYIEDVQDIQVILKEETNRLNDNTKQEIMEQNETNEIVEENIHDYYTQEPMDNENEEFINKNEIIKSNVNK